MYPWCLCNWISVHKSSCKISLMSNIDFWTLYVFFLQLRTDSGEERAKVREDDLLHEAKLLLQSLRLYYPVSSDGRRYRVTSSNIYNKSGLVLLLLHWLYGLSPACYIPVVDLWLSKPACHHLVTDDSTLYQNGFWAGLEAS